MKSHNDQLYDKVLSFSIAFLLIKLLYKPCWRKRISIFQGRYWFWKTQHLQLYVGLLKYFEDFTGYQNYWVRQHNSLPCVLAQKLFSASRAHSFISTKTQHKPL